MRVDVQPLSLSTWEQCIPTENVYKGILTPGLAFLEGDRILIPHMESAFESSSDVFPWIVDILTCKNFPCKRYVSRYLVPISSSCEYLSLTFFWLESQLKDAVQRSGHSFQRSVYRNNLCQPFWDEGWIFRRVEIIGDELRTREWAGSTRIYYNVITLLVRWSLLLLPLLEKFITFHDLSTFLLYKLDRAVSAVVW